MIYFTFDDGPHPELTPFVLDALEKFDAKATFFCVGDNVVKFPQTYRKILESGHSVGNHTNHHLKGWKTSKKDYLEDVERCSKVVDSKLFRPPYGKIKSSQAKALRKFGYTIIMWDVLSYDYSKNVSKEDCYTKTLQSIQNGSIIVFHDLEKAETNLRHALPRLLENLQSKGYQFKNL